MIENDNEETFLEELHNRIKAPLQPNFNWAFWGYFIGIVVLFGGLGVWFSIYESTLSNENDSYLVSRNLATFFISIWAASFIEINSLHHIQNKLSIFIYTTILFGIIFFLLFLSFQISSGKSFFFSIPGIILSLFVWYLAYADSDKFNEQSYNAKLRNEVAQKGHGKKWEKQ
ncbi:hypothetical protein [Echinicola shivajiensis]|uniref:hypothetical protein n=1 Tax=Echinicola shivajiensis TaxID=1035916 RepID=UPI001BFC5540|nr:hypothetical protein [Echinicola shivajiensis]